MALDLMLEAHGEAIVVLKVCWLPQSSSELAIVTNQFVKIYDLALDRICPSRYVQSAHGAPIADAEFQLRSAAGDAAGAPDADAASPVATQSTRLSYRLWVLSSMPVGLHYCDLEGDGADGPAVLQQRVPIAALPPPAAGQPMNRSGLCLALSTRMGALLAGLDDGLLVFGRPSSNGGGIEQLRPLQTSARDKAPAYAQILEWRDAPGVFLGWSCKKNEVNIIQIVSAGEASLDPTALTYTTTPVAVPPSSARATFEGVTLWSQSADLARIALLMEDGSLHLFSLFRGGTGAAAVGGLFGLERLAGCVVSAAPPGRALAPASLALPVGAPPFEFPNDFFEHLVNLTDPALAKDVIVVGDPLRRLGAEAVWQKLSSTTDEPLICEALEEGEGEGFVIEFRLAAKRKWAPAGVRLLLRDPASHAGGSGGAATATAPGPGPTSLRIGGSERVVNFWRQPAGGAASGASGASAGGGGGAGGATGSGGSGPGGRVAAGSMCR